ncbi:PA-phosphatase [Cyclobacterium jeungdonense]|uniref:PA-phosphatase n=1 Tax=Cyclobacterium jeungdonense TaxID=708087 RepID=A0ABT8C0W7_9BACT|nr:PA-phosphatase [Cyclobacterium jeungdonense]MDN3686423.1 PA-phosphatase [Cyclobacterium jeungdonense]
MCRKLAMGISVVFQPLVIPSLMVLTLFYIVPEATIVPGEAKWSLSLLIGFTTFLIPLLGLAGMRFSTLIHSYHLPDRKERLLPFTLVTVFYCMTSGFFYWKLNVDQLLITTLGMVTISLFVLTIVTYFWKISAHQTALGGWVALVAVLAVKFYSTPMFYYLLLIIFISGLVGTARLYLNAHKPDEVYGGFALGFGINFFVFYSLLMA